MHMFDIDFSSKKVQLAIRFFTYGVMTVSTIVLTILLVFLALGYQFDRKNLTFTQGGLVQFRSFPENASITINNQKQSIRTPNKANLLAGQHMVKMSLEGYREWSKSFDLAAGQLLWLNYVRFIPNTVTTSPVKSYDTIDATLASPNREWLLLLPRRDTPSFELVDLQDEAKPKHIALQIPETALTRKDGTLGTFELIEWDLSSRYVLIKHQHGDTREFIRLDRSKPSEAINITRVFSLSISEAHFSGNNANVMYVNTDRVLRRLDLSNTSASAALVSNLRQFVMYGENSIAFSTDQDQQQAIGIFKDNKTVLVRRVPLGKTVVLAYTEYDDHNYLAISTIDSPKIDILRDPSRDTNERTEVFAQFDLGKPVQFLTFSNNGRMLVAQNSNTFATYDIEEAKSYNTTLAGTEVTTKLRWLDDFYLWADAGGRLRIVEFDGQNERDITGVTPGYGILLSSNGKQLFSISKDTALNKFNLQTSKLVLED